MEFWTDWLVLLRLIPEFLRESFLGGFFDRFVVFFEFLVFMLLAECAASIRDFPVILEWMILLRLRFLLTLAPMLMSLLFMRFC